MSVSLPTWPTTLPQVPQKTSYQEVYTSLATSVVTGNKTKLIRRQATRAQDKISAIYVLSAAQVTDFESFYYNTLAGGTLRFTFPHPRTYVMTEVSLDPTSEQGFTLTPYESTLYFQLAITFLVWN